MKNFLGNKKLVSVLLIISIIISFSPIFAIKTEAQTPAGSAAGAGIVATAIPINAASCIDVGPPGWLTLGTGFVCDVGTRYNTLQILSSTVGVTPGVAQKESIWDGIAYFIARILIRQISQSIVNWINTGFQGNPSFVQDPKKFLEEDADRTIGEFLLNDPALRFLCDPFKIQVITALGLQYRPFQDQIRCTFTSALGNVNDAMNKFLNGDFIGGGGWDAWLQITTVPQNNQMGAMIIAQSELDARINEQSLLRNNELNWSGGLLSMKNCVRTTYDMYGNEVNSEKYSGDSHYYNPFSPGSNIGATSTSWNAVRNADWTENNSSTKDECTVVTPGVWITGTGNKVLGMDLDRLGAADEINEIVGALANFVITKVMEKGLAMVNSNDLSANNADWRAGIASLQSQQNSDINSSINATRNNSYYEPSYDSYTGTGNSGNNNSGYTGNPTVDNAKSNLQNYIASVKVPEQAYYGAYNYIYTTASTLETKFLGVVNCYQVKLISTILPLTATERDIALAQINIASTTASQMTNIKSSIAPNILSAQTNLTRLQSISDQINNAQTVETLTTLQTSLTNLTHSLHPSAQALEAQNIASTTINQITPNGLIGDNLQAQCTVFPGR